MQSCTIKYLILINSFLFYSTWLNNVTACTLNNDINATYTNFEVSELTNPGSLVYNFTITYNSSTPLYMDELESFELLNFGATNYGLKLLKQLLLTTETVRIICEQSATSQKIFSIYAKILDVDNNPPNFEKNPYIYTISEQLTIVGYLLPSPRPIWVDPDGASVQIIKTAIVPNMYNASYFEIVSDTSQTVEIKLLKKLDFEEATSYKFMIKAIDREKATNNVMFEANTTIIIDLSDIDDEPPKFTASKYTARILSNATKGSRIVTYPTNLLAFDGDILINTKLTYSISGAPDTFAIDNNTGWITLLIDNPPVKTHDLTVQAVQVDDKYKLNVVKLEIQVDAAFNQPPKFSQDIYKVIVSENTGIDQLIAMVIATDINTKVLTYNVKNFQDVFSFNRPDKGELFLLRKLDYETNTFYNISISTTDGEFEVYSSIYLSVLNENDNDPIFQFGPSETKYSFAIKREPYTTVGKITATDADSDSVVYSLTNFQALFSINDTSGVIILIGQFQDLVESMYILKVAASDTMKPTRQRSALVEVTFTDAAPISMAAMQVWPFIIIGVVLALILIFGIVAVVCFTKRSRSQPGKMMNGKSNSMNSFEVDGATSLQKNPIEGFNNFYYGDENEVDIHMYGTDRDVSEIQLDGTLEYSTNESISSTSFSGSHQNLIGNGTTLPIRTHLKNMELVQAENAIDASSANDVSREGGITIYF